MTWMRRGLPVGRSGAASLGVGSGVCGAAAGSGFGGAAGSGFAGSAAGGVTGGVTGGSSDNGAATTDRLIVSAMASAERRNKEWLGGAMNQAMYWWRLRGPRRGRAIVRIARVQGCLNLRVQLHLP